MVHFLYCLNFSIFSEFVATKKNGSKMLSKSTYEGCRSALRHMFWLSRYEIEKMFEQKLYLFMLGLVRKVTHVGYNEISQNLTLCVCAVCYFHRQHRKVIGGNSLHKGKKKMGFKVYKFVCKNFLEGEEYTLVICSFYFNGI